MLPKIIHEDQEVFMKGRYIGENIRLLYNVLQYAGGKKKKKKCLVYCLWLILRKRSTMYCGLLLKRLWTALTLVQTLNSGLRRSKQMQALVF